MVKVRVGVRVKVRVRVRVSVVRRSLRGLDLPLLCSMLYLRRRIAYLA